MNLLRPELLEALARDYVLGTMSGGARRRFEKLQREHFVAQQAVAAWSGRLGHLAAPVPPMKPSAAVWGGLQQRLFPNEAGARAPTRAPSRAAAPPPPAASPPPASRPAKPSAAAARRPWWQSLLGGPTWAGALAGVMLCVVVLRQQPDLLGLETQREALPASYVGLLLDPGGKPAVLASSRRQGHQISVKLLQPLAVPAGQVAQLWGLPKDGSAPFPIGQVPPNEKAGGSVSLPLADSAEKLFFNTSRLAVSLEAAPAKPGDKPSGDYVLSGHCVKLW